MKPEADDYPSMEWTPERVEKFWDYTSKFSDDYFSNLVGKELIQRVGHFLTGKNEVLDFGCGPGFLISHLLKAGYHTTGLDFSRESIAKVNYEYRDSPQFLGAFLPENMPDKKFDVIFLIEVIEHLDDEYLRSTFDLIDRYLADEGVLIVSTPNQEVLEEKEIFCPGCCHVFHRWQHMRSWSRETLGEFLKNSGFKVEACLETNLTRKGLVKKMTWSIRQKIKRVLKPGASPVVEPHLVMIASKRGLGSKTG